MNMLKTWQKPLISLGFFAFSLTGIATPSWGNVRPSETEFTPQAAPLQLAQNVVGQCRAARRNIFIYRDRSTNSPLNALSVNERVRLADNGLNGWIAVDSPITGFVQASDLASCIDQRATTPRPQPQPQPRPSIAANTCRQVSWDEGLEVKRSPQGDRVGGVVYAQQVTLTGNEQLTFDEERKANRLWAEISSPIRGWVTSGLQGGGSNLAPCGTVVARPPGSARPAPAANICRQVTWKDGLVVQRTPNGDQIGGVSFQQRIRITGNERVLPDPQGGPNRVWIEVASPLRGWVTNGSVGSAGRNLGPCV